MNMHEVTNGSEDYTHTISNIFSEEIMKGEILEGIIEILTVVLPPITLAVAILSLLWILRHNPHRFFAPCIIFTIVITGFTIAFFISNWYLPSRANQGIHQVIMCVYLLFTVCMNSFYVVRGWRVFND
jgi:hypothetical protein